MDPNQNLNPQYLQYVQYLQGQGNIPNIQGTHPNFHGQGNRPNFQGQGYPYGQYPFITPLNFSPQNSNAPITPSTQGNMSPPLDLPEFNTQHGVINLGDDVHCSLNETQTHSMGDRVKWSQEEDRLLISAWLNTSKDAHVGNDQKSKTFWNRIVRYYGERRGSWHMRKETACRGRWQKINYSVSKFAGCYEHASKRKASCESEDDVIAFARRLYTSDTGGEFKLDHAWEMLRMEEKWRSSLNMTNIHVGDESYEGSKRSKVNEDGTYYSSSNPESPNPGMYESNTSRPSRPPRPSGKMTNKGKGKGKGKSTSSNDVEDREVSLASVLATREEEMHLRTKELNLKAVYEERKAREVEKKAMEALEKKRMHDEYIMMEKRKMFVELTSRRELTPAEAMLRDELVAELYPSNN